MSEAATTAAAIARIRADEALVPEAERLFSDPYAALFVAADPAPEVTERMLSVPYIRESVRLRTRFIDDAVRAALAEGIRQVVILGAGFDCRGLRLGEIEDDGATVFEVDFAFQLETKESILARAGVRLPAHLGRVACDFADPGFDAALAVDLAAAGFRCGSGAIFVLEGVIGYLEDAAIEKSLRFVASAGGPGTRLVLNYQTFRFAIDRMAETLHAADFPRIEETGCDALHPRLIGGEAPELARYFRLALARTE